VSAFIYKLNAMENAAQAKNPAKAGYGDKRKAVIEYVAKLETEVKDLRARIAAIDALEKLKDAVIVSREEMP
jgi:hypothetical protein